MARSDVHVWRIDLPGDDSGLDKLVVGLDPEERARAERFLFPRDRRRFIHSHAALRRILAEYLGVGAAQVRFTHGSVGKPRLAPPFDASGLRFNLSHSRELALLAVTYDRPVGVDVEFVQSLPDALSLAETFFTPFETAQLRPLLGAPGGDHAFFRAWTRKEAFIKATGDGMSRPLDSFVVTFLPDQPAALLQASDPHRPLEDWSLTHLEPAPGYVGALVVAGPPPVVTML